MFEFDAEDLIQCWGEDKSVWLRNIARFSTTPYNYVYWFGHSRTRVQIRIRFRSYGYACSQQFALCFAFMFRVQGLS